MLGEIVPSGSVIRISMRESLRRESFELDCDQRKGSEVLAASAAPAPARLLCRNSLRPIMNDLEFWKLLVELRSTGFCYLTIDLREFNFSSMYSAPVALAPGRWSAATPDSYST